MEIKKQSGKRISQQIQKQIGSIVLAILLIIEVFSIMMVQTTVMDAKETELTLESKVASYQLGDYFDQYKRMTEQLAVNPQIRQVLKDTVEEQGITIFTEPYVDKSTGQLILSSVSPVYDTEGKVLWLPVWILA